MIYIKFNILDITDNKFRLIAKIFMIINNFK